MADWNEHTLRKAASWKAFKEGIALLQGGLVSDSAATPGGWRATVRCGGRGLRVSVTVRSATDLETRCPCPENQATGALCGHAVAAGLAVLMGTNAASHKAPASTPHQPVPARDVILGPDWRNALAHERLTLTISPSGRDPGDPADARLHAFLVSAELPENKPRLLQIRADHLPEFISAINDHPGVFSHGGKRQLEISAGHRLTLDEITLCDNLVQLTAAGREKWTFMQGMALWANEDFIRIAGTGIATPPIARAIESLARGMPAAIDLQHLLRHLELWQDWLVFPDHGWLANLHFLPAKPGFLLDLDGSLREIRARLMVSYPDAEPVPAGSGDLRSLPRLCDDICEIRDAHSEMEARRTLENAGFTPDHQTDGRYRIQDEPTILQFLGKHLPQLHESWMVRITPALERARSQIVVAAPHLEILSSKNDQIEFNLKYQTIDGNIIPIERIRQLLRSGSHHGRLAAGRHLWLGEGAAEILEPLLGELDLDQYQGRYRASKCAAEVILEIKSNYDNKLDKSSLLKAIHFQKPTTLQAELRPYQHQGCAWLSDRLQRFGGALLADDMGLGKTIQAIAVIESLFTKKDAASGPALVVATTSLLGNWRAEFARFAPTRRVRILHGPGRDEIREEIGANEVVITSYGTLARDLAWYLRREFRVIAVDEASLMRNPDTDHARAIAKLRSPHRIALTGTPVENGVRDLWSIFRFIQPGWLGTRADFRERYETPLTQNNLPGSLIRRLRFKTSPFILRRTKSEVAPELPGKLEIDEYCDLSAEQMAVYRDLLMEGRRQVDALTDARLSGPARMRMLTTLLRLRQTCCDLALLGGDRFNRLALAQRSAKIVRLMELLEQAFNGNHRVLVFSQFRKQLLEIEKCLKDAGLSFSRLDGQTRNRQELLERFQDASGPGVFLISLKAGGYGLNLTAADTVIHFDPWWNPAAEAQATDRAHRIGQTRPVTVYRLLTRGTVEEQVLRLQAGKRELARAIDEAGESEPPSGFLDNPERLRELFGA